MIVTRTSKQGAIELDRTLRLALRSAEYVRTRFEDEHVAWWREQAQRGVEFLAADDTVAGLVEFDKGQGVPLPEGVWLSLRVGSVWFVDPDLSWALYGDHADWRVLVKA
jgi:hypothetical protein